MGDWCTIESAPVVFTELIERIGVDNVEVEEMWTMDDADFARVGDPIGLVLLFRWRASVYATDTRATMEARDLPGLFFAKQIVTNACATQAILSILLNSPSARRDEQLAGFREFTLACDPQMRGEAIGGSDWIRTAHNSFAPPEPFISEQASAAKDGDDVFHFVSLLPFEGRVLELDGLKEGPIDLGASTRSDWVGVARKEIARRIEASGGDLHFTLMALVPSKLSAAREQLAALGAAGSESAEAALLRERIATLEAKRVRSVQANARRRHNYVPFIMKLLSLAAEKGALQGMVKEAQATATARRETRAKNKR